LIALDCQFHAVTFQFGDSLKSALVSGAARSPILCRSAFACLAGKAQLRASGIAGEVDQKDYPNGRFATLRDPEENPVQLWEPAGRDAAK
jgi:hypothetical protein